MTPTQKVVLYLAIVIGGVTLVVAGMALVFFSDGEPAVGSEIWCEELSVKPHEQWQEPDFAAFAKECLDPVPVIY